MSLLNASSRKPLPPFTVADDEDDESTRESFDMTFEVEQSLTPADTSSADDASKLEAPAVEKSEGNVSALQESRLGKQQRTPRMLKRTSMSSTSFEITCAGTFPAEKLVEYRWPQNRSGKYFMIQEQVAEYLDVKSFKRKYPDITRRPVDTEERAYLASLSIALPALGDFGGLTALPSDEVLDLMANDYADKYAAYQKVAAEREKHSLAPKHSEHEVMDSNKVEQLRKKAIANAAAWNADLNRDRKAERASFFDLQTMIIQVPRRTRPNVPANFGAYPVPLLPGQYSSYFKTYTARELKRLPVNTVIDADSFVLKKSCMAVVDEILTEAKAKEPPPERGTTPRRKSDAELVHSLLGAKEKATDTNEHCAFCQQDLFTNDRYVECSQCGSCGHATCLEMSEDMYAIVKSYSWECMECKPCSVCANLDQEEKMLFCDRCDRGYHTFCVGLNALPTGRWICPLFCGGEGQITGTVVARKPSLKQMIGCSECGVEITKENRVHHRSKHRNSGMCTNCVEALKS